MWQKLLALIESHPSLMMDAVRLLAANPALLPELVAVAKGENPHTFITAHPDIIASLLNSINSAVQADPSLIAAVATVVWGN